jgi:hypothetical protein
MAFAVGRESIYLVDPAGTGRVYAVRKGASASAEGDAGGTGDAARMLAELGADVQVGRLAGAGERAAIATGLEERQLFVGLRGALWRVPALGGNAGTAKAPRATRLAGTPGRLVDLAVVGDAVFWAEARDDRSVVVRGLARAGDRPGSAASPDAGVRTWAELREPGPGGLASDAPRVRLWPAPATPGLVLVTPGGITQLALTAAATDPDAGAPARTAVSPAADDGSIGAATAFGEKVFWTRTPAGADEPPTLESSSVTPAPTDPVTLAVAKMHLASHGERAPLVADLLGADAHDVYFASFRFDEIVRVRQSGGEPPRLFARTTTGCPPYQLAADDEAVYWAEAACDGGDPGAGSRLVRAPKAPPP